MIDLSDAVWLDKMAKAEMSIYWTPKLLAIVLTLFLVCYGAGENGGSLEKIIFRIYSFTPRIQQLILRLN